MMTLSTPDLPSMRLRQASTPDDSELLRVWKNAHRQHFFFKDEITPAMQEKWFAKHQTRKWDVMLLVEEAPEGAAFRPTGCMGFRLMENGTIDLYNILRGQRLPASTITMGQAFTLMLGWLAETYRLPIRCEVLAKNPVRGWYEALGLEVLEERAAPEPHVLYQLNAARLPVQTVNLALA